MWYMDKLQLNVAWNAIHMDFIFRCSILELILPNANEKKVFLYIIKIDDTIISYYHYIINKIQYIGHMGIYLISLSYILF